MPVPTITLPNAHARKAIEAHFAQASTRIYRQRDLAELLEKRREDWRVAQAMNVTRFVRFLLENTKLRRVHLSLPHRPETRYVWGDVNPLALALAIKPNSYLTHFSAMAIHELTDQVPKIVYVNVEQRPHVPNPGSVTQEGIDRAFRNQQRMTSNIAEYQGRRLVYLNGRFTGQLGVVDHELSTGERIQVTDLERTLVDIAVRPAYSGGVGSVAAAYRAALGRLSESRLFQLLTKMEFVYPYEQVIGYYLERAGVAESKLRAFRRKPFRFRFHLAHGMKQTAFVERWKLYVPKGLE